MDLFDDLSARAAPVAPGRARTAEGSDELAVGVVGVVRAPLPADEEERLRELDRYGVLDTEPEDTFDDLTRLAAYVCEAPIALISLVDAGRQWFKSRHGLSANETSRDISFCSHAILEPGLFVVPDALADPRFAANPLVTSDPHIRFYAGAPLVTPGGRVVGTLCVLDHVPRLLRPGQLDALRVLARQVVGQLELRRSTAELRRAVAGRESADRALEEKESVLLSFYEAAPLAMGVVELVGDDVRILSANAAAGRFLGRRVHEVEGALASQVGFSRARVVLWVAMYRQSARLGRAVRFEYASELSQIPKWYSATVGPVDSRPGGPARFSYVVEDVTERRQSEQELRDSHAFYSSLVESLPQKVFRKDLEGRFTFANARFCAELGLPHESVVGRTDYDFFPPDCAAKYRQDDRRVVDTGAAFETVEEHRPPGEGREVSFVHVTKVPIRDETGRVIGVQGVFEDVTAQRRAEEALRESEARFHAFMDHSPAVAFIKDEQGRYVYANSLHERLFRVPLERLRGKTDFDFLPAEAAWQVYENDLAVLAADRPGRLLESVPTPDGRSHDWLVIKFPFRDSGGRRMVGGVAVDITERKDLERRLAEQLDVAHGLNAELEASRRELAQANARLAELVTTDELTGLHNRRRFGEAFRELLSFAARQGQPLSLVMLDVDQFKPYNDTYGHPAGDEVLRAIAAILRRNVRGHDVVARYGGEEFAVIQPATDASAGRVLAERLRAALESHAWPLRAVTASFGVATTVPGADVPLDALVRDADRALYHSKGAGRNRVTHAGELPVGEGR
jgi:diguanylate cyclase (GGDEF)-like protein/PAS domain S-box-containing protein